MRQRKRQELETIVSAVMRALGHASPDPQVVSHCPFCGSGDVVARSDGNVECSMCTRQFTIAEQPAYSAIPGSNAGNGPQPAPPGPTAPATQHEVDLPAVDPAAAAAAPPFVVPEDKGADEQPPNLDGSKPDDKPKDDGNPFAKKSSEAPDCAKCGYWKATDGDLCESCAKEEEERDRKYRTQKGAVLSEADYVMHLALGIHPEVRTAVLGRREVNA